MQILGHDDRYGVISGTMDEQNWRRLSPNMGICAEFPGIGLGEPNLFDEIRESRVTKVRSRETNGEVYLRGRVLSSCEHGREMPAC